MRYAAGSLAGYGPGCFFALRQRSGWRHLTMRATVASRSVGPVEKRAFACFFGLLPLQSSRCDRFEPGLECP